jgi:DNA-directed RNA polymerase specialized sigma24 family protein
VCNPVRARLVRRAREFPWSSYRATVDLDPRPDWLRTDSILGQFGSHQRDAIKAFVRYIAEARPAPHLKTEVREQVFLGSEAFVADAKLRIAGHEAPGEARSARRRAPPRSLAAYAAEYPERNQAIVAAYRSNDHTQQAIAKHFGLHYTTVCRIIKKARAEEPDR